MDYDVVNVVYVEDVKPLLLKIDLAVVIVTVLVDCERIKGNSERIRLDLVMDVRSCCVGVLVGVVVLFDLIDYIDHVYVTRNEVEDPLVHRNDWDHVLIIFQGKEIM